LFIQPGATKWRGRNVPSVTIDRKSNAACGKQHFGDECGD
jgi:hypothetical protein